MFRDVPTADGVQLYIYADDVTVSCSGLDPSEVRRRLQQYLHNFAQWACTCGLILNPKKTSMQHYTRKKIACPVVKLMHQVVETKKEQRLMGLVFDSPHLNWNSHVSSLRRDCLKRIDLMKAFSSSVWGASTKLLRSFYIAYIRSKVYFGSVIYGSASKTTLKNLIL
jgi:hypothetical protein